VGVSEEDVDCPVFEDDKVEVLAERMWVLVATKCLVQVKS